METANGLRAPYCNTAMRCSLVTAMTQLGYLDMIYEMTRVMLLMVVSAGRLWNLIYLSRVVSVG